MHHPTDRIAHTMAFVTPVVEHWLEREIAQWGVGLMSNYFIALVKSGDGWPQHRRPERDGLALAPPNGGGMETSRYRRAERDGIAPTPQSGEGWAQHRRPERNDLALAPPSEEGWDRTDTAEWRWKAPVPQTGEGWSRPSTSERWRDGNVPIP